MGVGKVVKGVGRFRSLPPLSQPTTWPNDQHYLTSHPAQIAHNHGYIWSKLWRRGFGFHRVVGCFLCWVALDEPSPDQLKPRDHTPLVTIPTVDSTRLDGFGVEIIEK